MIQVMLWLPLAVGLLCLVLPKRALPMVAVLGALGDARSSPRSSRSASTPTSPASSTPSTSPGSPTSGVRYQLGIDGISVFLVVLTALVWAGAVIWSAFDGAGAAADLLPDAAPRRDRDARRVPRPGPAALRPLLRPDAGPVLLPLRELGRGERRRQAGAGDDEDDGLHARRLAADAGRRDRRGDPGDARGRADLVLDRDALGEPAARRAARTGSSGSSRPPSW